MLPFNITNVIMLAPGFAGTHQSNFCDLAERNYTPIVYVSAH